MNKPNVKDSIRVCWTFFLSILILFSTQMTINAQSNWVRTNPGGGGAVSMITGTANGTILSGSDLSGVYKSVDNGQSWTPIGSAQGLTRTHITSLAPHASDGNTFFIGTGSGIFKTNNGGNNVTQANIEVSANSGLGYVEAIEMCNVNQNKGYAAHHEWWSPNLTLLKTVDGGDNWFILTGNSLPAQGSIMRMMAHPQNDDLVYALLGKGRYNCSNPWLYKSTDGGWNWTRVAQNLGDILDFDLHPTNQQIVFTSTFQSNGCNTNGVWDYAAGDASTGELYRSNDAGWNYYQIGDYTGFINVSTANPNEISVTNFISALGDPNGLMGTWKTWDNGNSWYQTGSLSNWVKGWPVMQYAYVSSFYGFNKTVTKDEFNSGNYYATYGGWAWVTPDGGANFTNVATTEISPGKHISTGMDNINGNAIEVSDTDPNIIYVGYYDLGFWYSRDRGQSWTFSIPDSDAHVWYADGGSNVNFIVNDPARPNVVWATFGKEGTSTDGAVFKSTAYGENWQLSNSGLQYVGNTTHGMSMDMNSPVNNRTLFVTQDGDVFKSVDDGASWFMVLNNGGLKFTAVDEFNSQLVYAGGENGFWRSTNGGTNWAQTGLPEMRNQQSGTAFRDDIVPTFEGNNEKVWNGVFEIKVDPAIPNRVYASAYGNGKGMYRSNDGGLTWTKLYTDNFMRGIAIHPTNSDLLYISSGSAYHSGGYDADSKGFLTSEDGGQTWNSMNADMSWPFGGRMEIDKGPNPRLWAWSPGTGVQYTQVPGGVSEGCITIDNDFNDWSSIATLSTSNGYTTKAADDDDALYMYIDGNIDQSYQIFVDADNDNASGNEYTATNWGQMGANILIENGDIYTYNGTGFDWIWVYQGTVSANKTSAGLELKIDKSFFNTNVVNFGFLTRDANWTQTGFTPASNAATHIFSASLSCDVCPDADGDGVCDADDACPGIDDALIGTACDDGDSCTQGETYNSSCQCTNGTYIDADADGVCIGNDPDDNDACTPNACDTCISVDGNFSDWSSVPILSISNGFTIKATHDNDAFYIYVTGNLEANNQFFLDADNNNSGGNEYLSGNWGQTGFNYLIQNNNIASYIGSGADWIWDAWSPINVQKNSTEIEVEIDKSSFTTDIINFGFITRDANWAQTGFSPSNTPATYTLSSTFSSCNSSAADPHIITSANSIEIIPNPLVDKVVIDGVFGGYTLQVLDVNGTLVADYTGTTAPLIIDLNTLGAGIYFISIVNNLNGQINIHKMIKM